jgi:hypothetical protein
MLASMRHENDKVPLLCKCNYAQNKERDYFEKWEHAVVLLLIFENSIMQFTYLLTWLLLPQPSLKKLDE